MILALKVSRSSNPERRVMAKKTAKEKTPSWTEERFKKTFSIRNDLIPNQTIMRIDCKDGGLFFDVYQEIEGSQMLTPRFGETDIEQIKKIKIFSPEDIAEILESMTEIQQKIAGALS